MIASARWLPRKAAIMGIADGLTTGIDLVFGMTVTGQSDANTRTSVT
jgi:hypothetical protein